MTNETEQLEANRKYWDEAVPVHVRALSYDVDGFKAGRTKLYPLELSEVGDVKAKTLLHLQCHFGLDTLCWAREGAIVTGVDFSAAGVRQARALASEAIIDARFIESNVYDLSGVLDETFDVVFTSYGVLNWLPDLKRWADIVTRYVKPGGVFYIAEFHPSSFTLNDSLGVFEPQLRYPYFEGGPAIETAEEGTYADRTVKLQHKTTYGFAHSLGEVVSSLIDAGLQIEFLHEHPFTITGHGDLAVKGDDGYYHLRSGDGLVPMMFSLRARKPA